MMEYKIIASDLDGTLLNSNSEVSKENIDAINKLAEKGVAFVPCTGRTFSEIPKVIKDISAIRYIIHSNGATVLDRETGHCILNCIPKDISVQALDIITSFEAHVTFRYDGQCFVDSRFQSEEFFKYYNVIVPHQVVVRDFAVHLDDFEKVAYEADNVEVFSVFFRNYEDKLRCKELVEQTGVLKTVEAGEYNLEIMNIDAGKGNALYSLADMLNVSYDQTMGLGDSDNDNSLICAAGLGLCASNGCESLKAVADELICSNDEHVVEYVLKRYF